MTAILRITDGTTIIDLLSPTTGFHLAGWEPAIAQYKGGGMFSNSPLADGRRLVDRHFDNVIDIRSESQRCEPGCPDLRGAGDPALAGKGSSLLGRLEQ